MGRDTIIISPDYKQSMTLCVYCNQYSNTGGYGASRHVGGPVPFFLLCVIFTCCRHVGCQTVVGWLVVDGASVLQQKKNRFLRDNW